jgi:DNA-binding CsgD family transcriptional regulator
MTPLSTADYEVLLEHIQKLHSFQDLTCLRVWLLEKALPQLVPSEWFSYNEVDLRNPENTVAILQPEASPLFRRLLPRFREVAGQNPLIVRQMRQSDDFSVHKISDFLAQEVFHQLPLYQEVYRLLGVEYQIAATIKLEPDRVTAFALSRRRRDYTERDRAVLELLRPHLVVVFNRLALASQLQTVLADHSLALNRLSSATVIVNPQGRILFHAGPGLGWIGATAAGCLPADISGWLKRCPPDAPDRTMRVTSEAGEVHLQAVPTTSSQRILLVLTLKRRGTPENVPVPFGLTPREVEVGRWIGEGKANAEIAVILGVSPRTVHKHIEHIFEKTGATSRLAVATLLNHQTADGFPPLAAQSN